MARAVITDSAYAMNESLISRHTGTSTMAGGSVGVVIKQCQRVHGTIIAHRMCRSPTAPHRRRPRLRPYSGSCRGRMGGGSALLGTSEAGGCESGFGHGHQRQLVPLAWSQLRLTPAELWALTEGAVQNRCPNRSPAVVLGCEMNCVWDLSAGP